jgi:hypothetical protein
VSKDIIVYPIADNVRNWFQRKAKPSVQIECLSPAHPTSLQTHPPEVRRLNVPVREYIFYKSGKIVI